MGSVRDVERFGRPQTFRTSENIEKISARVRGVETSGSERCYLHEDQAEDALEEIGLQVIFGDDLVPDSISAVMTIVFLSGDFAVIASILPLFYRETPLPQLV
ncbi:hypothetical protein TNCV_2857261 [Trichonephila clavipes]|nr:hypothetical protein TNCV_2857261 [Trichonephila clavipes]